MSLARCHLKKTLKITKKELDFLTSAMLWVRSSNDEYHNCDVDLHWKFVAAGGRETLGYDQRMTLSVDGKRI